MELEKKELTNHLVSDIVIHLSVKRNFSWRMSGKILINDVNKKANLNTIKGN